MLVNGKLVSFCAYFVYIFVFTGRQSACRQTPLRPVLELFDPSVNTTQNQINVMTTVYQSTGENLPSNKPTCQVLNKPQHQRDKWVTKPPTKLACQAHLSVCLSVCQWLTSSVSYPPLPTSHFVSPCCIVKQCGSSLPRPYSVSSFPGRQIKCFFLTCIKKRHKEI